jgi:hypothetical protein
MIVPTTEVAAIKEKMMIASFTDANTSQILSNIVFFFSSVMHDSPE